ncbi:MATE family efflux transporter [Lentisphaerota bacterium ZTH]|nr:MATE family efflux transporter [Lentisphaerota bacterium]WET05714.1 MATE family efflux transporter [Lentisphaerota bacterium ZTH]
MQKGNEIERLGSKPVLKLLLEFLIPAVIGMMTESLYNIVDRIFVGHFIGEEGLSALTLAFPVMMVLFGIAMLFGEGGAALFSLQLGRGDKKSAARTAGNVIVGGLLFSLLIVVGGHYFSAKALELLSAPGSLTTMASDYTTIICYGTPYMVIGFCCSTLIRAEGFPRFAVVMMLVSSLVNIVLDPIFIYVLDMGVEGAALATVIAQAAVVVMGFYHYSSQRGNIILKSRDFAPSPVLLCGIIAAGTPSFMMDVMLGVQNAIMNKQLIVYGGERALAAMGIIFAVETLLLMPLFALVEAIQPVVGYNYGAGRYGRVVECMKLGMLFFCGFAIVTTFFVEAFPGTLVNVFCSSQPELEATAAPGLMIFVSGFLFTGIYLIATRYFQAVGKAAMANILTALKPVFLYLPLLLVFSQLWGLAGIWWTEPVSSAICAVLCCMLLFREYLKLNQNHESKCKLLTAGTLIESN